MAMFHSILACTYAIECSKCRTNLDQLTPLLIISRIAIVLLYTEKSFKISNFFAFHNFFNLQFAAKLQCTVTLFITVHSNKQLAHVNKQCKITCACLSHSYEFRDQRD